MRKKIGTTIDETVFRRLRVHAAQRGRSVADVIEESVVAYLTAHEGSADERIAAYERFVSPMFTLSQDQLRAILDEDSLDQ